MKNLLRWRTNDKGKAVLEGTRNVESSKNDPEKYGKTVLNLKATAAKEENKNAKMWMNFVSPPKEKKTVQTDVVEIVDVQSDKSKSFILVFCLFQLYKIHQREQVKL